MLWSNKVMEIKVYAQATRVLVLRPLLFHCGWDRVLDVLLPSNLMGEVSLNTEAFSVNT